MVSLRLADPSDYVRVVRFYRDHDYLREVGREAVVFLAEQANELIGLVRLQGEFDTNVLRGMVVAERYQRRGIGTALLREVERYLGSTACYCLPYLHLVQFYGQIGFGEIAVQQAPRFLQDRFADYVAEGLQATIMLRPASVLSF